MTQATCARCGETKPAACFRLDPRMRRGLDSWCKDCHREASRASSERYNLKRRQVYESRQCETCSEQYTPHRKDQRYCCTECNRKKQVVADTPITCARCKRICLKPAAEAKRGQSYCSKSCAKRTHSVALVGPIAIGAQQRIPERPEPQPFTARLCRTNGCPNQIVSQGQRIPSQCPACIANATQLVTSTCLECGKPFQHQATSGHRFCRPSHAKRNQRRRDKARRSKRIKAGVRRETIDLPRLAERDGWRCHICKRKVTRKNWSHDHLIPVSYGGPDTYDNSALAHHRCNSIRGNKGAAQLLLIG
jgi:hypothetical protein